MKCSDCAHAPVCPARRDGGGCGEGNTHADDCGCNECALRRLVGELVTEVKRLRHDLDQARTAMIREIARKR
jgi:hypothetical protein